MLTVPPTEITCLFDKPRLIAISGPGANGQAGDALPTTRRRSVLGIAARRAGIAPRRLWNPATRRGIISFGFARGITSLVAAQR
jgi:hypothetical protein